MGGCGFQIYMYSGVEVDSYMYGGFKDLKITVGRKWVGRPTMGRKDFRITYMDGLGGCTMGWSLIVVFSMGQGFER